MRSSAVGAIVCNGERVAGQVLNPCVLSGFSPRCLENMMKSTFNKGSLMRPFSHPLASAAVFFAVLMTATGPYDSLSAQTWLVTPWPRQIPCRVADGIDRDLFVATLGDVRTPLADGTFDPWKDEVHLNDGKVLSNYYKGTLGVKYFRPLDKRAFALPPSGWCSWYYYYQEINETDLEHDAAWVADHLRDFGARYIQIDDGWQGTGHGSGDNRDWMTIDKRFPGGMSKLASDIRKLGMKPGIWLAPHGQSNPAVVKSNPGVFLLKPDGSSASETWEGKYLVDPSTSTAGKYLKDLFTTITSWGYEYCKIDGQPIVIDEYRKKISLMKNPQADADALYRGTLDSIRSAIGPDTYLLGCWGIPLDGIGIMNGSRTGDDVLLGWDGFKTAVDATMQYYYLHNIAWYCDPDIMLVRSPLTIDQARAWATLQGLTGQALMTSDRLSDLSEERMAIVKKVYPPVDIRPLDLFPSRQFKKVWDLKVNHLGASYDVVGVFNFGDRGPEVRFLSWKDLGIVAPGPLHVYDFWNEEYLGSWDGGISVEVAPTSCRVLALVPDDGRIRLVSTNRHITQGWVDLDTLTYNAAGTAIQGVSHVIRNEPYQLRFAYPRGKNFVVTGARAGRFPIRVTNHQGWATVEFTCPANANVVWDVEFAVAPAFHYPVVRPNKLSCSATGVKSVLLRWEPQYYLTAGYQVYLDSILLGYTPTNVFPLSGLDPERQYTVSVASAWDDGSVSKDRLSTAFRIAAILPERMFLSEIGPTSSTSGWGTVQMDRSVAGNPLSVDGRRHAKGLGTHADSDIEYDLGGLFTRVSSDVGIDDANGGDAGSVEFTVLGDGKELWKSGVVKKGDAPRQFMLSIEGVQKLTLRVRRAGEGIDYDHADWLEAMIERNP